MDEKPQTTHQRILDAAIEVFASKGYHNARVDEIVDVSGTSKGSVYFHFPSKEDIFLALVDEFAGLLEKRLQRVLETESSGVSRVQAALRVCIETFQSHQALAKIFLIQAVGLGEAFEVKRQQINEKFALIIQKHIEQAIAEGEIPALDAETAAHVWMGAIYDVVVRWVQTGHPQPERMLPTLQTMLLRSIGVAEERIRQINQE
jgi:TetR/AcrR family fatty acid metabolism transcriptional regulator